MTAFREVRQLDGVRVSARRRGPNGVVVSVEVASEGTWRETVKIDAFGQAHWHLYFHRHGEEVVYLDGDSTLCGGEAVLDDLPRLLERAGYSEASIALSNSGALQRVRAAVDEAVRAILDPRL